MNEHLKKRMGANTFLVPSGLLKTLKLFLILILFVSQTFAGNASAQSVNVKLLLNKPTVAEVVEKLSGQTGYEFSYDAEILSHRLQKNVLLDVKNERIETVLSRIFTGSDVSFRVMNNRVFLKSNKTPESATQAELRTAQQQGKTITGTIIDANGEPVIGATVVVQGDAARGTVTDIDGNYILSNVPENATLVVSYVGMQTQTIPLSGRTSINITLTEDTELLDEVVVVGYGTMKRENLTGAVTQVKMEEVLGDRPVNNAWVALQGAIPGLTISGGSTPGQDNKNINIRGTLSINGGSPLVLIDNVPGSLNMINPEDIESVSVLKDAASSAIYGARAANGVVLITTKRPRSGSSFQLNYNNNFGFSTSINRPEQAPLTDYFQAYKDAGFSNSY